MTQSGNSPWPSPAMTFCIWESWDPSLEHIDQMDALHEWHSLGWLNQSNNEAEKYLTDTRVPFLCLPWAGSYWWWSSRSLLRSMFPKWWLNPDYECVLANPWTCTAKYFDLFGQSSNRAAVHSAIPQRLNPSLPPGELLMRCRQLLWLNYSAQKSRHLVVNQQAYSWHQNLPDQLWLLEMAWQHSGSASFSRVVMILVAIFFRVLVLPTPLVNEGICSWMKQAMLHLGDWMRWLSVLLICPLNDLVWDFL